MNSRPQYQNARERADSTREEEELETGEAIPEEAEEPARKRPVAKPVVQKKISAMRGKFNPQADPDDPATHTEPPAPGEGRIVLSSAKYLQKNTDPEIERENRKRRQAEKAQREGDKGSHSFEKGVFNSGVVGGILAMGGAVLWFVVGLMNDIIFFYPPILFVIGLGAFFKGLAGSSSE
jgi:hypothetical protein